MSEGEPLDVIVSASARQGLAKPIPVVCPLCRRSSEKICWRENGYVLRQCDCGVLYTSPAPNTPVDAKIDLHHERSEEHTSELQSLMRISYAVFCLKKKNKITITHTT